MNPVTLIVSALTDLPRWTWRGVVGLLLVVLAYVVPRLVAVSAGLDDILDVCSVVGAALIATEVARARAQLPPSTVSAPDQRGHARGSLLVALLALGLGLLGAALLASAAGCSLIERRQVDCTEAPEVVLEDLADGRCVTRGYCDGHELWTAIGPGPCGEIEERRAPPPNP